MSSLVGEAFVRVRPQTSGFQAEAQGGVQKAGSDLGKLFARAFAVASAVEIGKSVLNAALEHQSAFAVLDRTITNAGATTDLYGQSIEGLLEKEARLKGFSDEQLASAFQRLVSVTHDSRKAFKDLGEAEDLARFRHIGVEQAALGLAKAEQGNANSLQRYGIVVPHVTTQQDALKARYVQLQESGVKLDAVQKAQYESALQVAAAHDKQATAAEALALVEQRVGGSAGTFADTEAGKIARATQNLHQFEVEVGDRIIPAISVLFDHLSLVAHVVEGVGTAFVASKAISYVEGLAAATGVESGSAVSAAGAVTALTAALVANTAALVGDTAAVSGLVTIYGPLGEELSVVATGEAAVGTSAVVAAGEVSTFAAGLAGLAKLGPIAAVIALSVIPGNKGGQQILDQAGIGFAGKLPVLGGLFQQEARGAAAIGIVDGPQGPARPATGLTGVLAPSAANALADALDTPTGLTGILKPGTKQKLNQAGRDLLKSLVDGIQTDQTDLQDLKTQMADAVQQGVEAVDQAVNQAKQNLNTIGQSLAGEIGQIIDKPITDAQNRLTAAQNRLGLQSARLTLKNLGEEILLPGGRTLSSDPHTAIRQLEALQRQRNSPALAAFITQYEQASLGVDSAGLAIRSQHADLQKQGITRRIGDLTDLANQGKLTPAQFTADIQRELTRDGAGYKKAGVELGQLFADGFRADVEGLGDQLAASIGGPQRPGSGLGPQIVRPIETLQQVTRQEAGLAKQQRAAQLDETKKQTALLKKIHNNQAASDFTNSLTHNPGAATKTGQKLVNVGGG